MRFGVFPAALVILCAARAEAQSVATGTPRSDRMLTEGTPGPEQAAAHEHFERALGWYRAGKYRRAVDELDAALASDPGGKDLVFNLALVQEKLGDLSGAIRSLQRFQGMEKDPQELERAAQTIERLQGAQAELIQSQPRTRVDASPKPCPRLRPRGKLDAWVATTGSLSIASFVVGAVFGVRALSLEAHSSRAHGSAVVADFAFATSLLAGGAAAALYFGRYADVAPEHAALPFVLPRVAIAGIALRY